MDQDIESDQDSSQPNRSSDRSSGGRSM
jgi:hypothetical protein